MSVKIQYISLCIIKRLPNQKWFHKLQTFAWTWEQFDDPSDIDQYACEEMLIKPANCSYFTTLKIKSAYIIAFHYHRSSHVQRLQPYPTDLVNHSSRTKSIWFPVACELLTGIRNTNHLHRSSSHVKLILMDIDVQLTFWILPLLQDSLEETQYGM